MRVFIDDGHSASANAHVAMTLQNIQKADCITALANSCGIEGLGLAGQRAAATLQKGSFPLLPHEGVLWKGSGPA